LVSCVFSHLNACSTDYSRVVGAWLRLHSEELPKEYPVGFDPHNGFAKMNKHRGVENAVGFKIQVLDAIVPEYPLKKSLVGIARLCTTNLANMGISSGFFSIAYGSPVAGRHKSISFSRRNPLFT
jgi:hypothetical protein